MEPSSETSIVDSTPGTTADTKVALLELHAVGPTKLFDTGEGVCVCVRQEQDREGGRASRGSWLDQFPSVCRETWQHGILQLSRWP